MNTRHPLGLGRAVAVALGLIAGPLWAGVVAHWRFEGDGGRLPAAGSLIAHSQARTTVPPTGGTPVIDVSGNGNLLYGWGDGGSALTYATSVASPWTGAVSNERSVALPGPSPRAFTWSTQSQPPGIDLDTWQPSAWTIECTVWLDPSASAGWRTFLGRDGYQVATGNPDLGSLYFQKTSAGHLRLEFVDAAGNIWQAVDSEFLATGRWIHVAATSDGTTLRLYKWDRVEDPGYALVAETDIGGSADSRLAADTITSTGLPFDSAGDPMNWSVGSAMYGSGGFPENGHVDRWIGGIDEIRFSDEALSPAQFLFAIPLVATEPGWIEAPGGASFFHFAWNSVSGAAYRVSSTEDLVISNWVPVSVAVPSTPPANQWTSQTAMVDAAYYRVAAESPPIRIAVDPEQILNPIDERIYGHFLEHIFHSVNGGLWGELVWNRSFESLPPGARSWSTTATELVQSSLGTNVRLSFGDTGWTDYEFSLEALKDGGDEGFLILFRSNGDDFYWLNLGGWGNTRHQLEKGQGNPVGPEVAGSIQPGQWYRIRIRCEANRFRVYLDDALIIDYTDPSGPYFSGEVGVGTWATQARFRNMMVNSLEGTPLFSGIPNIDVLPTDWEGYGAATLDVSPDAYNSHVSVAVSKTSSGEGGLRQSPFRFDPQPVVGSLWAKGNQVTGMNLRLKDGATVLAETTLGAPGPTWQAYPFTLTPSGSTLEGTLEIAFQGTGTGWVDQVSLMGQDAIDTGGYRPDLLQAAAELAPPVIRWPGGCYASAYQWKHGIGPQHARTVQPVRQWSDRDVNAYGTDEFIQMCQRIGAEPILVLNTGVTVPCDVSDPIGTYPPPEAQLLQDALDWIEYCNGPSTSTWGAVRAANGHPEPYHVKYWEIDNETWSMGSAWYIGRVNLYAPLMRQVDPRIEILAVGGGGFDQGWNQDIIGACADVIDYISVHSYFNPAEYASGPSAYEAYLIDLAATIASSSNPDIKIYNSEWNAQSIDLRTGLFAGGILNVFERRGDTFKIGGPALMYRHLSANAWNNAFVNFDHTGSFRAPNYIVMKLWRDHYAPWRIAAAGAVDPLNLVATRSDNGDRVHVKTVNPTTAPIRALLELPPGTAISGATMGVVADVSLAAANSLAEPGRVRVEPGVVHVIGSEVDVTFPAQSASVVSIEIP